MGGKTPTRLADSCGMYLEADEVAIYEAWIRGGKQVECDVLLANSNEMLGNSCSPLQ